MRIDLETAKLFLPALVVGITVHEFAHAWVASLLGDDLARRQGRVSLNPLRHLSPLGTLVILFLPFGWGRPVPVNPHNFKHPRWDYLLTSLAGPAANIVTAALILPLTYLTRHTLAFGVAGEARMVLAHKIVIHAFLLNLVLATLNLLPIPPLDGSKIWPVLIPRLKGVFEGRTSVLFLIGVFALLSMGALNRVFDAVITPALRLLPATDGQVFNEHLERWEKEFKAGRYEQARQSIDAALAVSPGSWHALYCRASTLAQLEQWEPALADINRAIELDNAEGSYYTQRAIILEALSRPDEAAADRARADSLADGGAGSTRPGER